MILLNKPYTIRRIGLVFFWRYVILFEGDTELFVGLGHDDAEVLCAALNGAYNLGCSSVLGVLSEEELQKFAVA